MGFIRSQLTSDPPTLSFEYCFDAVFKLVFIKATALWYFLDMGQSCTLTSCLVHMLSSGQERKCGYLERP